MTPTIKWYIIRKAVETIKESVDHLQQGIEELNEYELDIIYRTATTLVTQIATTLDEAINESERN